MNSDQGFIDLRMNAQEGQNQESFWPSFTDIMTVVVMIFMIAMVVLLLRNIELVHKLRSTMEAEREAMELARSTGEEKENISVRLMTAENELAIRRMQQLELEQTSRDQKRLIASQTDQIGRMKMELERLTQSKLQLTVERRSLSERLQRSNERVQSLQQDQQSLGQELSSTREQLRSARDQLASIESDVASLQQLQRATREQLDSLQQSFSEQAVQLQQAKSAMRSSGFELSTLRGEYDKLKVEYERLFRPARSPKGRYQVFVRYSKTDGTAKIEFATETHPNYQTVNRSQLEQRLTELKAAHSNGLYIKVIFPENSGLAYNEAWKFTTELHAAYDYYSQPEPPAPDLPEKGEGGVAPAPKP
ncbi:MAG: hypothetical protein H6965_16350 [Chromatiaceae bacterium]|nr:hypothetical protein [Chromatiaceae bacterium]